MKTGLGLGRKYNKCISYINLFRFTFRKVILGFEAANLFFQRANKHSVQLILKYNGATIGVNCDIETGLVFHNCKSFKNLIIGENCHIGKNCFFDLRDKVIIGNNVVISMQCSFITHIDMSKSVLADKYPASSSPVEIGNDCYVGARSTVLSGAVLASQTLVASGAVVTRSFSNNSIIGGVPAVQIKNKLI